MYLETASWPTAIGQKTLNGVDQGCRSAGIGCVERSATLFEGHQARMGPIHERRVGYDHNRKGVLEVLESGASPVVEAQTMGEAASGSNCNRRPSRSVRADA